MALQWFADKVKGRRSAGHRKLAMGLLFIGDRSIIKSELIVRIDSIAWFSVFAGNASPLLALYP